MSGAERQGVGTRRFSSSSVAVALLLAVVGALVGAYYR
jgi:hypothetical protein